MAHRLHRLRASPDTPGLDLPTMACRRDGFPVGTVAIWHQGGGPNVYMVHVIEHVGYRTLSVEIVSVLSLGDAFTRGVVLQAGDQTYILPRNVVRESKLYETMEA